MSNVRSEARSFFDLYSRDEVAADQIDDFVTEWHDLPEGDDRPLAHYLGMSEAEYIVWVMAPGALPVILTARNQRRPLVDAVGDYLADLRREARPSDRTAVFGLSNWLQHRLSDDRAR